MPNRRGMMVESRDLEQANPFPPGRFSEAEPQQRRGQPGSRDRGTAVPRRPRSGGSKQSAERVGPREWTGINPLPPIDPSMPLLKPGDQAG